MSNHIDAYAEYRRIVGDDDNGTLFTAEEYERYKKRVFPLRLNNRLYVSWQNSKRMDCKLIGPEVKCLCQCRYKNHVTDVEDPDKVGARKLKCKKCSCKGFVYVWSQGPRQIKCACKHDASMHDPAKKKCYGPRCSCTKFHSSFRCPCGETHDQHKITVETKVERQAAGKPVGQDVPYIAMGGITGFSSLLHGMSRLDPSGIGDAYRALE